MPKLKTLQPLLDELLPCDAQDLDFPQGRYHRHLRSHDDVGVLYTRLAMLGEVDKLEELVEAFGPVPVDYEWEGRELKVNNIDISNTMMGDRIDGYKLARLMELLPRIGLGFLTGVGKENGLLINRLTSRRPRLEVKRPDPCEFPVLDLDNLNIQCPEMLLALKDKSKHTVYPKAYQQILCWVPEHALESINHQCVYQSVQNISITHLHESRHSKDVDIKDIDAQQGDELSRHEGIALRSVSFRTVPLGDAVTPLDIQLIKEMGSLELKYGFGFKEGYALVRMHTDDLSHFSIDNPCPVRMDQAFSFVESYAPIGVLAALRSNNTLFSSIINNDQDGIYASDWSGPSISLAARKILKHIADQDVLGIAFSSERYLEGIKCLMKLRTTHTEYRMAEPCLDLEGFIVAHNTLGIATDNLNVEVKGGAIDKLLRSDITFSPETHVSWSDLGIRKGRLQSEHVFEFKNGISEADSQCNPGFAAQLFAKGVRILNGHDLSDVKKSMAALAKAVGKDDLNNKAKVIIHKSRIKHEGLEESVRLAKTVLQWQGLEHAFGRKALAPYLEASPRAYRAESLSMDLGL